MGAYRSGAVLETVEPVFMRRIDSRLREALRLEMTTGEYAAAGSNHGNRFTPFKETCEGLLRVVKDNPGIDLKRAIDLVKKHHYSSNAAARANIRKYIETGVITGLTHEWKDRKMILSAVLQ